MLAELFPETHEQFSSLVLLGRHLDDFVAWLSRRGYPDLSIRSRVREAAAADALIRESLGIQDFRAVTRAQLVGLASEKTRPRQYLMAMVRSLADYLDSNGILAEQEPTPREGLLLSYRDHVIRVRGLASSTAAGHTRTASDFLSFLGFDRDPAVLGALGSRQIEAFLLASGGRLSRATLQHTVANLRSFLRFLAGEGSVPRGLDSSIDTPRLYRDEKLPRALPWDVVRSFLAAIDRSTPLGRRDYAMFLLIATYGLRVSEVVALTLDDVQWRSGRLRVPRPKTGTPLILPLTPEVEDAIVDYLRRARPGLPFREIFLRVRAPLGPLGPTALGEALDRWVSGSGLPIPFRGPHCLRHSVAVHLLRQGASIQAIGDLLGHRSLESTCVYLRLHTEDLRDAALELPEGVRA